MMQTPSSGSSVLSDRPAQIRVTTWNLLAPVIDASKMFPGVSNLITDQATRTSIIQRRLVSLDSDVLLLQEVRPSELEFLLQQGEEPLGDRYEHHIALEKRGRLQHTEQAELAINTLRSLNSPHSGSRSLLQERKTAIAPRALGSISFVIASLMPGATTGASPAASMRSSVREFGEREDRRGVAILWRKHLLANVCKYEEVLGDPLNPAAFVRGFLPCLDLELIFASKHLDALGCPPSVAGAERELLSASDVLVREATCGDASIIFGGDCNLTIRSPSFASLQARGFRIASALHKVPTCFSVICSSRLDHIFANGPLAIGETEIPECGFGHCCLLVPFFHQIQVMTDVVSQALLRRKETSCCRCFLGYLLFLPLFLVLIIVFLIPLPLSMRRCRWALREYGSDHLPVTVTFLASVTRS